MVFAAALSTSSLGGDVVVCYSSVLCGSAGLESGGVVLTTRLKLRLIVERADRRRFIL